MAANAGPPPSQGQQSQAAGEVELTTGDEVKEYRHDEDGENEYLNPMDLHDIKSELEKDAEKAETPKGNVAVSSTEQAIPTSSTVGNNHTIQLRPTFVLQGLQYGGISYGYPPTGFVSAGLPIDQSFQSPYTLRMPGQYITQMPYTQQQLSLSFGTTPIAPNASVHPNSGMIVPQQKEKKPHIKKPLNAFMLFMKEKRSEVMKECTLKESAAINQILGKMWHKLDKGQQAKYYEMAREERSRHMKMYPNWSARDNYAIHKKRKKKKAKTADSSKNDEDSDDHCVSGNVLKCRARLGLDKQEMWCEGCRKKKKCIRSLSDDGTNIGFNNPVKLENQT